MATNSTATRNATDGLWEVSESLGTITSGGGLSKTILLQTANQYVDKNIQVTMSATGPGDAVLGASATGSATVAVGIGAKASGKYPFTGSANITGTASASTTTSGFATAGTTKATGSTTGTAGVSGSMDAIGLSASGTGSATVSSVTVGTKDTTNSVYLVTGNASISGTASASVSSTGYGVKGVETGSGSVTGTASVSANIAAAAATVSLAGTAANPTVAIDATNDNILASAATTTKPGSGYYAAVKATAPKTTLTATKTLTTAGYLGTTDEITASGETTAKTGSIYYVPITAGALDNKATDSITYTENTTVTVPSEGALYINEGYYPNIKITLDQMLDGKTDTAGIATSDIRTGQIAYNVDGKKLTGTMGNATVTSGGISATAVTPSYNSTNGNYDVAVTATAAAPTVGSAGYISSSDGTKNSNSTVTSTATLGKVALSTSKTSGNLTVAPTLARTAKPSGDTWTDAAGGAATTTKPTSGAYVQIDAAAATNTLKVKPTVATAGYGDTTNYDFTEYSASVGAAKATTAYVPIATATPAFDGGALTSKEASTTINSNISVSTTDTYSTGLSLQPVGKAGRAAVLYNGAVEGWVSKADDATASAAVSQATWNGTTQYITGLTIPSGKTFGNTSTNAINIAGAAYIGATGTVNVKFPTSGSGAAVIAGTTVATNGALTTGTIVDNSSAISSVSASTGAATVDETNWKLNIPLTVSASGTAKAKGGTSGWITSSTTFSKSISKTDSTSYKVQLNVYSGAYQVV